MNVYANVVLAAIFLAFVIGAYVQGRSDGDRITKSEFLSQRIQEVTENQIAIAGAYRRKAEAEAKWSAAFASISSSYQKDLKLNANALDVVISGSRLFDRNAKPQACGDTAAATAGSASGRDGSAGAYLPEKTGEFLRRLASEADAVVLQLTACQGILKRERM